MAVYEKRSFILDEADIKAAFADYIKARFGDYQADSVSVRFVAGDLALVSLRKSLKNAPETPLEATESPEEPSVEEDNKWLGWVNGNPAKRLYGVRR